MFDFSLFYLEFDNTIGPKIEKTKSLIHQAHKDNQKCKVNDDIEIDAKLKKAIINNSFPESIKKLKCSEPYFFTFTFNQDQTTDNLYETYYCYSIYMNIPDINMKRNFHQFSYVIGTKIYNPSIFKKFLISAFNSFQYSSSKKDNKISNCTYEIFDVLYSFLNQWSQIISLSNHSEIVDLPLINGNINVTVIKINSKELEIIENDHKNSISFFEALNLDKIKILDQNKQRYSSDSLYNQTLKLLWECLVFNKNILVIGNTPSEASDAVFAISSLIKQVKLFSVPYISVTDNFFIQMLKKTGNNFPTIVGVSNPISEFLIENNRKENNSFFDFIYYVGFDDKVGFKDLFSSKSSFSFNQNTKSIQFNDNSKVLAKIESFSVDFLTAIDQYLIEISQTDFSSLFKGKINVALLSKKLVENKVKLSNFTKNQIIQKAQSKNLYELIAEKLVNTQLFIDERKQFVYLSEFSQINLVEKNFVRNLLKDIKYDEYKIIENESDSSDDTKDQYKFENKLMKTALKIYIHALQTPINEDLKNKLKKVLKEIIAFS